MGWVMKKEEIMKVDSEMCSDTSGALFSHFYLLIIEKHEHYF